jgi:hypothetical protein
MMKKLLNIMLVLVLGGLAAIGIGGGTALAHESRDLAKYRLVVGFIAEPALEGQKNGVDFRVTNLETQAPVEGVEKTVQVEITHVPTGVSKVFNLRTIFRDPGHYTSDLILTASGHYRMRFFGTIDGANINETFNSRSGGGNFNDVDPTTEMQFPVKVAEVREIEAVARHIEEENHDLEQSASRANMMAIVGVALGGLGTIVGIASLATSRRKAK